MPYRQNAPLPSSPNSNLNSGSLQTRYTNPARADDLDNGGTNPDAKAACRNHIPADTFTHPIADTLPARKVPSSFMMTSTSNSASNSSALQRDNGGDITSTPAITTSTRRRQSSIPSAKVPMGPRPLDYGSGTGKRYSTTHNTTHGTTHVPWLHPQFPVSSFQKFQLTETLSSGRPAMPLTRTSTLYEAPLQLLPKILTPTSYPSTTFQDSALHPYKPSLHPVSNAMPLWILVTSSSLPSISTTFKTP